MIQAKFKSHCILRANVTRERHLFNMCNQCDDETIDQYTVSQISKRKHRPANSRTLKMALSRTEYVVCGIQCDKTHSRLLKEPDLTLQKAIDMQSN